MTQWKRSWITFYFAVFHQFSFLQHCHHKYILFWWRKWWLAAKSCLISPFENKLHLYVCIYIYIYIFVYICTYIQKNCWSGFLNHQPVCSWYYKAGPLFLGNHLTFWSNLTTDGLHVTGKTFLQHPTIFLIGRKIGLQILRPIWDLFRKKDSKYRWRSIFEPSVICFSNVFSWVKKAAFSGALK